MAPELKKLQSKYKDDKQRQQQEIMKFYAENKINPFASCLPLLAQFPFFIGLYYLLQSDLRFEICGDAPGVVANAAGKLPPCGQIPNPTGAEQFLFVPDLTAGATGWVLAALMILYVGSQLLSTLLTPATPDRNQQMLMYGLPLVFAIFILLYEFPAGLLVYWITTNLWTVGQGWVLRKKLGPIIPIKPDGDDKDADGGGGKEGFLRQAYERAMEAKAAPATAPAPTAQAERPAAALAAQEEEALRAEAMTVTDDEQPGAAVRELLERVVDALGLDATVEIVDDGETCTGTVRRRGSRAVHRPPRPDDRSRAASRAARLGTHAPSTAGGSSSTRRATANGARGSCAGRPTRRRRTRCGAGSPGGARRDDRRASGGSSTSTCASAAP